MIFKDYYLRGTKKYPRLIGCQLYEDWKNGLRVFRGLDYSAGWWYFIVGKNGNVAKARIPEGSEEYLVDLKGYLDAGDLDRFNILFNKIYEEAGK